MIMTLYFATGSGEQKVLSVSVWPSTCRSVCNDFRHRVHRKTVYDGSRVLRLCCFRPPRQLLCRTVTKLSVA